MLLSYEEYEDTVWSIIRFMITDENCHLYIINLGVANAHHSFSLYLIIVDFTAVILYLLLRINTSSISRAEQQFVLGLLQV